MLKTCVILAHLVIYILGWGSHMYAMTHEGECITFEEWLNTMSPCHISSLFRACRCSLCDRLYCSKQHIHSHTSAMCTLHLHNSWGDPSAYQYFSSFSSHARSRKDGSSPPILHSRPELIHELATDDHQLLPLVVIPHGTAEIRSGLT